MDNLLFFLIFFFFFKFYFIDYFGEILQKFNVDFANGLERHAYIACSVI